MSRARPKVGLAILPAEDLRLAQLPLFADGLVEAIEWTLDAEFGGPQPRWIEALLDHYASADAPYAHGVQFSPLSAIFEPRQAEWLRLAERALSKRRYQQVSEHFGFTTVPGLARGTPLPVPFVAGAVAIGRERLRSLRDVAGGAPVGLENLALAMSREDVLVHGEFLEQLLEPIDGFLLLDLHNLYCQAQNFAVAPDQLALAMPLQRVREVHVSGGSWSTVQTPSGPRPFRRDTHDSGIPEDVFALLAFVIPRCPQLEVVFLERLGNTLTAAPEVAQYRADYERVRGIVRGSERRHG
jgi:uncharacterized protein (UPF0276 family)